MNFYNQRMWKVKETADDHITFELDSPDGDQGYPGAVHIEVTYTLTEDNAVKVAYHAVPDADTLINMTNHSYFNMDGHAQEMYWIRKYGLMQMHLPEPMPSLFRQARSHR